MNRLKNESQKTRPNRHKGAVSRTLNAMLNGEFLTKAGVVRHLRFILFLTGLFLLYISIGYFFENTLREHVETKKELEEATARYNATISELENRKQASEVIRRIETLGLSQPEKQPTILEPLDTSEE